MENLNEDQNKDQNTQGGEDMHQPQHEAKKRHPVVGSIQDLSRQLSSKILTLIVITVVVGAALLFKGDDMLVAFDMWKSDAAKIDALQAQLKKGEVSEDIIAALLKVKKNPDLDGIVLTKMDSGMHIVYPANMPMKLRTIIPHISTWAQGNGYDTIIFGRIWTYYDGNVVWSDFNGETITDFEILNKKIEGKKVLSLMSNPDFLTLGNPYKSYVMGPMTIAEIEEKRFNYLWKTGDVSIYFTSENMEGKISSSGERYFKFNYNSELDRLLQMDNPDEAFKIINKDTLKSQFIDSVSGEKKVSIVGYGG